MKSKTHSILAALFVLFTVTACGGDGGSDCSDSLILGTYNTTTGDTLTFNSQCEWTSAKCKSSGTYPSFTKNSGTVTIQVSDSPLGSDFDCLDEGSASCTYILDGVGGFVFTCSQN